MKTRGTGVSHLVPNDPKKPAECNKIVDKDRPDFEQRFNPSATALEGAIFFLSMRDVPTSCVRQHGLSAPRLPKPFSRVEKHAHAAISLVAARSGGLISSRTP